MAHVPNDVFDKLTVRFLRTLIIESGFKIILVIKNKNNIQIINESLKIKKHHMKNLYKVVEETIQRRSDYTRIENIGLLLFVCIMRSLTSYNVKLAQ